MATYPAHDPATCRNGDHYGQCGGVTLPLVARAPRPYRGDHDSCGTCTERIEPCQCGSEDCQGYRHLHGSHWCSDGYHVAKLANAKGE
jgi:hypothetical protein